MAASGAAKLAKAVRGGDRRALAQAITLIESAHPDDRAKAGALLEKLAPHAGKSIRVGISGVPGVGKSTFIESLGNYLIDNGHKVAVLAVDPSSAISGGSILGDKTRMEELSKRLEAFIRPSPAGRTLGGVARHTRETMLVAEAAGFDVVLVETVGVGQSETAVSNMTDMFVLMLLPGGGDELQGIKRGIVELADLILVNKADGEQEAVAERSAMDYRKALQFLHPHHDSEWTVRVETCSSLAGDRTAEIWGFVEQFRDTLENSGELAKNRADQAKTWLWSEVADQLLEDLKADPEVGKRIDGLESKVKGGKLSPTVAAQELIDAFLKEKS